MLDELEELTVLGDGTEIVRGLKWTEDGDGGGMDSSWYRGGGAHPDGFRESLYERTEHLACILYTDIFVLKWVMAAGQVFLVL